MAVKPLGGMVSFRDVYKSNVGANDLYKLSLLPGYIRYSKFCYYYKPNVYKMAPTFWYLVLLAPLLGAVQAQCTTPKSRTCNSARTWIVSFPHFITNKVY